MRLHCLEHVLGTGYLLWLGLPLHAFHALLHHLLLALCRALCHVWQADSRHQKLQAEQQVNPSLAAGTLHQKWTSWWQAA
jgi:hypothetical protein